MVVLVKVQPFHSSCVPEHARWHPDIRGSRASQAQFVICKSDVAGKATPELTPLRPREDPVGGKKNVAGIDFGTSVVVKSCHLSKQKTAWRGAWRVDHALARQNTSFCGSGMREKGLRLFVGRELRTATTPDASSVRLGACGLLDNDRDDEGFEFWDTCLDVPCVTWLSV